MSDMTLRDKFAESIIRAKGEWIPVPDVNDQDSVERCRKEMERIARGAYLMADVMIEVRNG